MFLADLTIIEEQLDSLLILTRRAGVLDLDMDQHRPTDDVRTTVRFDSSHREIVRLHVSETAKLQSSQVVQLAQQLAALRSCHRLPGCAAKVRQELDAAFPETRRRLYDRAQQARDFGQRGW